MTSQGSPYTRYRRSLDGSLLSVKTAALELPRIGTAEAAEMLLVVLREDPDSYEATALWVLQKLIWERRDRLTLDAIKVAASALESLPDHREEAMEALREICDRVGLQQAARVFG